jgi:hypothetical protein
MSKMSLPGFTADVSLYRTSESYSMITNLGAIQVDRIVYPQRATGPAGPIGLPGQGCNGACLHICMMGLGGWFLEKCMSDCLSQCYEPSLLTSSLALF